MKKTFSPPHSGLYKALPTICAELTESIQFCQRGTRVYFAFRPSEDDEFIELLGQTRLNQIQAIVARWDQIRLPVIRDVPAVIAERCWRGTREETEAVLQMIIQKVPDLGGKQERNRFAPDVEV